MWFAPASFAASEPLPGAHLVSDTEHPSLSPALSWGEVPEGTVSMAFTCDMITPGGSSRIWHGYNLPGLALELGAGAVTDLGFIMPDGKPRGWQGLSDNGLLGWDAPDLHTIIEPEQTTLLFTLYALDRKLPIKAGASTGQVTRAMEYHILDTCWFTVPVI